MEDTISPCSGVLTSLHRSTHKPIPENGTGQGLGSQAHGDRKSAQPGHLGLPETDRAPMSPCWTLALAAKQGLRPAGPGRGNAAGAIKQWPVTF